MHTNVDEFSSREVKQAEREAAKVLRTIGVTPILDVLGRQVHDAVKDLLDTNAGIFPEWVKIGSSTSSPGAGAHHHELEVHVPTCELWEIVRQYDDLEDFDPHNIFSREPPRLVELDEPVEHSRRRLSELWWLKHRHAILEHLIAIRLHSKAAVPA